MATDTETDLHVVEGGEGNVSIEEMAEEERPVPPMQLPLPGTRESISSSFGGSRPTESEIKLLGGKQPILGQFEKGEDIELVVTARIVGVLGQDVVDEWGNVVKTQRRHMARIVKCQRIVDEEAQ